MKTYLYFTLGFISLAIIIAIVLGLSGSDDVVTDQQVIDEQPTIDPAARQLEVYSQYLTDLEDLPDPSTFKTIVDFAGYINNIDMARRRIENQGQSQEHALNEIIMKIQVKADELYNLPKLRSLYCNMIKEALWIDDIEVECKKDVIRFNSYRFVRNAGIKECADLVHPMMKRLEFRQSQFSTRKDNDEYTYYTLR
jgi:hypothetical protein